MYFEWMDGIPIIVSGCHEHNAEQYARAAKYYEEKGHAESAEHYTQLWKQEKQKAYEDSQLTWFDKVLRWFMK